MKYHNIVRDLRIECKMSQESLADASGLSVTTIKNIESGNSDPTVHNALKIVKALNDAGGYLFYLDDVFKIEYQINLF